MNIKRTLGEMLLLIGLAVIAGLASNIVRPESTRLAWIGHYDLPGSTPIAPAAVKSISAASDAHAVAPAKDPAQIFLAIDGEVAERLHKAGAFFVDARRSSDYAGGHIAGARNIAVWEHDAEARISALSAEKIPFDGIFVIYCSGNNCTDSEMLAQKMAMSGYFNLYVYRQGFPDWERRGGTVNRGSLP